MRNLILAPLLLLGACGGGEDAGNNSSDDAATTVTEPVPDNATVDPQNSVVPLPPAASPTPVAASGFPQAFQGRWGLGVNDCDPARDDSKGLMVVSADAVGFYESRGVPSRIEATTPTRLVAEIAFTGEGQQWTKRTAMQLQDGGRTLVREESDPAQLLRYARCPG